MTSAEVFLFFFFTTWIDLKSPNSPSPWRGGFSTTAMCVPTRRNGVWHAWYYVAGVAGSGRSCCDSVAAAFWGNHGVSGWTGRKRRVFNCETSVQAVDWAMNHQETTGKPTFFDHEWGNQELIFFHDIWTWAAENRSQQWPSHPRGLMYWFVEASFPESTRWWFSQL